MNNITIIGGDKRQRELKNFFVNKGYRCKHIVSSDDIVKKYINRDDVIILPVPATKDGEHVYSSDCTFKLKIKDVLNCVDKSNCLFGGNIPPETKTCLNEKGVQYFDYLECEEVSLYNAYLTGLGSVKLLFENTQEDMKDKKVLITGFGKVAKYTGAALKSINADVYIAARNKLQLTQAECEGYKVLEFDKMKSCLYLFDYIFNTVPHNIFLFEDINHIKGKYFELASLPFGTRKEYFIGKEENYIFGGSLPGKYLSCSAAEKLANVTINIINIRNGGD